MKQIGWLIWFELDGDPELLYEFHHLNVKGTVYKPVNFYLEEEASDEEGQYGEGEDYLRLVIELHNMMPKFGHKVTNSGYKKVYVDE